MTGRMSPWTIWMVVLVTVLLACFVRLLVTEAHRPPMIPHYTPSTGPEVRP